MNIQITLSRAERRAGLLTVEDRAEVVVRVLLTRHDFSARNLDVVLTGYPIAGAYAFDGLHPGDQSAKEPVVRELGPCRRQRAAAGGRGRRGGLCVAIDLHPLLARILPWW